MSLNGENLNVSAYSRNKFEFHFVLDIVVKSVVSVLWLNTNNLKSELWYEKSVLLLKEWYQERRLGVRYSCVLGTKKKNVLQDELQDILDVFSKPCGIVFYF